MLLQIVLIVFLFFAVSRVLLQLRQRKLTIGSFLFWGLIFFTAIIGVIDPNITTKAARFLGIGRGADAVIYFSIVILFYLIFRLTIVIEEIRYEITNIIRQIALSNARKKTKKT